MIELAVDQKEWEQTVRAFFFKVSRQQKRWILSTLARKSISMNRARIREQENLDGTAYVPRSDGTTRKMLRRILKGNRQVGFVVGEMEATIKAHNPVAARHHFGERRTVKAMTKEELESHKKSLTAKDKAYQARKQKGDKIYSDDSPCSASQARELKKTVKRFRKQKLSWIKENFTVAQAGYWIRKARIEAGQHPKRQWEEKTPPREVLGITPQNSQELFKLFQQLVEKHSY